MWWVEDSGCGGQIQTRVCALGVGAGKGTLCWGQEPPAPPPERAVLFNSLVPLEASNLSHRESSQGPLQL